MIDVVYHLLCVSCRTAVVADSIAKRERVPRLATCPVCGERRGETWRPVEAPADHLRRLVPDYDTVEIELDGGEP